MEEELKKDKRNYYLKNLRVLYDKISTPNPDCIYALSLREKVMLITAIKELKNKFFDSSDCTNLIETMDSRYKTRKKVLKRFIKNQED